MDIRTDIETYEPTLIFYATSISYIRPDLGYTVLAKAGYPLCCQIGIRPIMHLAHRENTRREESKYLKCENRHLGLIAIAAYIFKTPTEKFKIGR